MELYIYIYYNINIINIYIYIVLTGSFCLIYAPFGNCTYFQGVSKVWNVNATNHIGISVLYTYIICHMFPQCAHWLTRKLGTFRTSIYINNFHVQMGVSKNRGTPKWMVYNGKPY